MKSLTNKIGIAPNQFTPPPGQTRPPLAASIRHAVLFCLQHQTEIDQRDILFHRQAEPFMKQAIKDVLPYLLGAVREDQLALEQQLARLRRELSAAKRDLREAQQLRGDGVSRAIGLLAEAREVGLLDVESDSHDVEDAAALLHEVAAWSPEAIVPPGSDALARLQSEVTSARQLWAENAEALRTAKAFAREAEGYVAEGHEQELRLESIGLFEGMSEDRSHTCPLCTQHLSVPLPHASEMQESLERLRANLQVTTLERPRLREYIESLEREREHLRLRLQELNGALNGVMREQEAALRLRDLNIRRAQVVGRIGFWLENRPSGDVHAALEERVRRAQAKVDAVEEQLDPEARDERLDSILNRIGLQMTQWADALVLEHAGMPVRLDWKQVTVVVDRPDRPIPLARMGSGKNWVAYHLITYLALHRHFRRQGRPVPHFIVFDQPSQAYYPAEWDPELRGSVDALSDEDRKALARMYDMIFAVVDELAPDLQVIITDHADLTTPRFHSAVVETWRGGSALIPSQWLEAAPR